MKHKWQFFSLQRSNRAFDCIILYDLCEIKPWHLILINRVSSSTIQKVSLFRRKGIALVLMSDDMKNYQMLPIAIHRDMSSVLLP
jgi:hypothetical protein